MKHLAVIYFMVCTFGLLAEDRKEPFSILHLCEKGLITIPPERQTLQCRYFCEQNSWRSNY